MTPHGPTSHHQLLCSKLVVEVMQHLHDFAGASAVWLAGNPDQAAGAATGLWGAWLLGSTGSRAPLGWLAFLASNVALVIFAWRHGHHGVLVLQLGFMVTSVRGIWRALVAPFLDKLTKWEV